MKFEKKYISGRFIVVVIMAMFIGMAILARALYTMTAGHDHWAKMAKVFVIDSTNIKPNRGNILSSEGLLMASSLPDYKIYLDFKSGGADKDPEIYAKKDTLFHENLDSICAGLSKIIPDWTPERFKEHLEKGWKKGSRYYDVTPGRHLSYIQFNEVMSLPMFNLPNKNESGVSILPRNNRKKPFGSLAKRTLGEMFGAKDSARSGIELAYDSLLRGKPGKGHKKKVRSNYTEIVDREPENGYDLLTTIDVSMQDICESTLRDQLKSLKGDMGVVILMETKTGDIKAIVNLMRYDDGNYYEAANFALASLMEPGSTFKTASLLVALDDGVITPDDKVDVGCGVLKMHGSQMKDHNWTRGGYNKALDVTEIMMYSSNVGTSVLIDNNYGSNPQKFVDGLKRIGIGEPLNLPFVGMADPRIRQTDSKYWSKTSLAWMSIGYENQIPPISTAAFYNAIANNGKMVRPRFVKGIMKDGELIEEFPVEVIKEKICNDRALKDMQTILEKVVSIGTGKKAGNKHFPVSGKTGTAQIAMGGNYRGGNMWYLVSFCGYFPSDNPQYTCMVAMRKPGYPASGGTHAGPVFSAIAQKVYSKRLATDISKAKDSTSCPIPDVLAGDMEAAQSVLEEFGISSTSSNPSISWQTAENTGSKINFTPVTTDDNLVPDVTGMGARDAVYALESKGLKVKINGYGKVVRQSIPAGREIQDGQEIAISLDRKPTEKKKTNNEQQNLHNI